MSNGLSKPETYPRAKTKHRLNSFWQGYGLMAAFGLSVVVIAVLLLWFLNQETISLGFSSEEVVYGQSLHVIHDMNSLTVASAPFPTGSPGQARPKVEIPQTYYDFGGVQAGKLVSRDFPIANRGDAPLEILGGHTTCGCTTANISATEIPAGKIALMTIFFDAGLHALRGQTVRRGVMIQTNDPGKPVVEVWVQATIK